ncbi:unnamed protein product [Symbiodinium natans]|uniref:Uncharacterized protein n=1 Tax=Symbiodinium natans TaxID=878477 RepID=A0A812LVZ3_9DINO|nr:unnamed protein product [Symbiodinium natans]
MAKALVEDKTVIEQDYPQKKNIREDYDDGWFGWFDGFFNWKCCITNPTDEDTEDVMTRIPSIREMSEIIEENDKKSVRITFVGSPESALVKGRNVIVSYPGAHGAGWNFLVKNSLRLGTANFNNPDTIATTCVFLPDENAPGWGDHAGDKQKFQDNEELCHCHHLYNGEVAPWGCLWFQLWLQKTTIAVENGCQLIVVTKRDGSLGRSQQGEVKFLQKYGVNYKVLNIFEFAKAVFPELPRLKPAQHAVQPDYELPKDQRAQEPDLVQPDDELPKDQRAQEPDLD